MVEFLGPELAGLILAVAIGFLVGLEREWSDNKLIGLRSFAMIGAAGGLTALLAHDWGGWVMAAGLLAVAAVVVSRYLTRHLSATDGLGADDGGITTALAALAVFLVGAACVAGFRTPAVIGGGVITILLHWKRPLHDLVDRIGETEFSAIIRLVLITLVVLPILPNETYGPYDVFNPYQTWLLAVLIVALNLAGYVAFRLLSADSGAVLAGVLGGMVSSTATTVSFAGMTRRNADLAPAAAMIILLASAVVYVRVAIELAAVSPGLLREAALPMGAFGLIVLGAAALLLPRVRRQPVELPEQRNPARLRVALTFAALYAVIIVAVAATREHLGQDAIYVVAVISGLTDVDAMTLSVGQLHANDRLDGNVAWRAVFLATLANLAFKIAAACVLGNAALRNRMLVLGGATLTAGFAILVLWP